jgi:PAS domain S-box-containing protein
MTDKKADAPKANLLIVDDTPVNLHMLSKMLTKQGYSVTTASSGPMALDAIQTKPPDLILLDVMMPDMDGYEVCKQLKTEARTRDIPIIFLSASHQTENKVKAFAVGGVDYITRPFQSEEVWARVETHLALRHLQKHLQEKNDQLYNEIVERRKAETALQQSNNRYSNLAQSIPAMIYQYVLYPDGSQKFLYVSPACRQLYGLEPEAMVKKGVLINHNVHPDDSNALEKSLAAALNQSNRWHYVWRIIVAEQIKWVQGDSMFEKQANETIILDGQLMDITELKQTEKALRHKNDDLANTLQQLKATQQELIHAEKMAALGQLIAGVAHEINTPLGAIQLAVDNLSTFLTQTLTQLPPFFRTLTEAQYQDFLALLVKAFQNTEETTLSFKEQRRLKRALVHRLEKQGIENATNMVETLIEIGVYEDIERFIPLLTGLDHNTILNIAYKLASLQQSTQSIASSSKRAAKVVFALKSFARFDSVGEKVEGNISEGIETVLTLYYNQLKHGVEVKRYYDVVPNILCYPDELNQVWTNLIHNALQAMDYQGTLTIVVKKAENQVLISVTDTGTGIPEEIKQKIFEPFFTTKSPGEGSGLGLDIVKKIIDKHEGKIDVESTPGKTTFTVFLPV